MIKINPKEIKPEEIFGIIHPYVRSREWWIIITSNEEVPFLELMLTETFSELEVGKDLLSWEEQYEGFRKFGVLVTIIRHGKASFEQMNQCFEGKMTEGKDIYAYPSREHPEYSPQIMEFVKKLSDFMNDSDNKV
jgi:hypothetical protein